MPVFPPPHPGVQAVRPEKFRQRVPRTTKAQLAAAKPAEQTYITKCRLQPLVVKEPEDQS